MNSNFGSLNIALRALQSMQRSIEVTNHNIANAATPGYSRQKTMLTAGDPYSVPAANRNQSLGQVGTGVTVKQVQRYRSSFLEGQIRQETLMHKGWEVRQDALRQIQVAFNEPSNTGINHHLGTFWSAWQTLAATPDSATTRAHVAETAATFAASVRGTYQQLSTFQGELDNRVKMQVEHINDLTHQIAQLNGTIRKVQGLGQQPNDLRDERDKLLAELSGIINVDIHESENGSVMVNLGGRWMIDHEAVSDLAVEPDPANVQAGGGSMLNRIVWAKSGAVVQINGVALEGGLSALAADRLGGELGGALIARDLLLTDQLNQLDTMASTLIGAVNGLHQTGFGLNGTAGGGLTATNPVPGTVNNFSAVAPWADLTGLADGTYSVEIRDNNNTLEFRLVDGSSQAIAIDDAAQPGTTTTTNWQSFSLVSGTTFDTGRGLAIDFAPLADHSLGSINTNVNVTGFSLSGAAQGTAELPDSTYYAEIRDNSGTAEFRLVDASGNPVQIYDGVASDGSLTGNWQSIPAAPNSFDTRRGLTLQFSSGPYVEAVRGGSMTPPPIPAANAVYTARGTQVGTVGAGAASVSLGNFFSGTGARDIAVSDYINADYNRIATAATSGSPGDGSIALGIAQLQNAPLLNGGTTTIGDFYRAAITEIGQEAQQATIITNNHELLTQHLQSRQEEIAGVSLDEEMVHLLQYQRTYQAAARVMTTVDEMLDKVINGMGVVGR